MIKYAKIGRRGKVVDKMELKEVIEKRQSIRKYKDEPISNEEIQKILEAGRLAPSGKNMQNWFFVAIKNKEKLNKVVEIIAKKNQEIAKKISAVDAKKGERFIKFCQNFTLYVKDAPVLVLIFAQQYIPTGYEEMKLYGEEESVLEELMNQSSPGMQSVGAAIENMMLMATNLGYGSCWLTSANYANKEIEAYAKLELGLKEEGYFFASMMPLGIPAETVHKSPGRKPLEEISVIVE